MVCDLTCITISRSESIYQLPPVSEFNILKETFLIDIASFALQTEIEFMVINHSDSRYT